MAGELLSVKCLELHEGWLAKAMRNNNGWNLFKGKEAQVYVRSSSKRHQFNVVDVFISCAGELHESGYKAKSGSITHTLFFAILPGIYLQHLDALFPDCYFKGSLVTVIDKRTKTKISIVINMKAHSQPLIKIWVFWCQGCMWFLFPTWGNLTGKLTQLLFDSFKCQFGPDRPVPYSPSCPI